jgi:hypothetical protein
MSDKINPDHYQLKAIPPLEYIVANNMNFMEGNVVKYVSRYQDKNGLEDLKKAKWYIEALITLEEGKQNGKLDGTDKASIASYVRRWITFLNSQVRNKEGQR